MPTKDVLTEESIETVKEFLGSQGIQNSGVLDQTIETGTAILVTLETRNAGRTLLKFYNNSGKYEREVTTLQALSESGYTPSLLKHGELDPPMRIQRKVNNRDDIWRYFILREWVDGKPGAQISSCDRETVEVEMQNFCDICADHGVYINDMKPDAFVWQRGKLTWVDLDGFKKVADDKSCLRRENRRYVMKRLGSFGIFC